MILAVGMYKKNKMVVCLSILCGIIFGLFWWFYPRDDVIEEMFKFTDDARFREHDPVMYCGEQPVPPPDYDVMGTRNKCLRKGVGVGMNMPDDKVAEFLRKPRDRLPPSARLYCGDKQDLPDGYDGFGTKQQCMRKGVGIGMAMPAEKRLEMQARPLRPLGKIELMDLANRLKITTHDKTRQQTRDLIADRLRAP